MAHDTNYSQFIKSEAVHPTVTAEQISLLVDRFYERVRKHPKLGPIFEANISMTWDRHIMKMKCFWRSVLLKTGEYKGKPVPVHQRIMNLDTDDFREWLCLFSKTSAETFDPQAIPMVNEVAERIATSLWLSRSQDPFVSPPVWSMHSHSEKFSHRG